MFRIMFIVFEVNNLNRRLHQNLQIKNHSYQRIHFSAGNSCVWMCLKNLNFLSYSIPNILTLCLLLHYIIFQWHLELLCDNLDNLDLFYPYTCHHNIMCCHQHNYINQGIKTRRKKAYRNWNKNADRAILNI